MRYHEVEPLTKEEILAIQSKVRKRDHGRCLICGQSGAHVHEILAKSSGGKGSREVYVIEFMGCACYQHHIIGVHSTSQEEADAINAQMLLVMKTRYGYKYSKKWLTFIDRHAKGKGDKWKR
jgi:hypothetical protein